MAYTKTNWINDSIPAINAGNLNKIEQGIYDNSVAIEENTDNIGDIDNLATQSKSDLVNAINSIVDSEVYSTDEVKTNKVWIDGKPIYRKVIQFTTTIQGANMFSMAHNISNADYIYVEKFYMSNQDSICYEVPLVGYAGNTTDKAYSYIDRNNLYVYSTGGWNTAWVKNVIIEYTKTTD